MLNRFYSEVPFLRIILPFCIGILLGFATDFERSFLVVVFVFLLLAICADLILKISSKFSQEWIYGITLQLILIVSGLIVVDLKRSASDYRDYLQGNDLIMADLVEFPEEKPNTYKAIARVRAVKNKGNWIQSKGKCLIYFRKEDNSSELTPGDRVIFVSGFSEIPFNGNPYEFNYKKYMYRHGVFNQIFLEKGRWKKIGENKGNPLFLASVRMQDHLYQKYREYGLKGDVLDVAGALTLGLREKLGDEIRQSYRVSGVVHILAISGLHIGILYIVLFYSLSFLRRRMWGKIIFVLVIMAALWFFALLTGLSPSVLRASTMFSFVLIGQTLSRSSNVFNSLTISAFILLFINPFLIFNVGFQLSYCAVLGIVILQPRLHNLVRSRFWFIDKISGLVAVSIAAQLATFPLSLYYFHQFPLYFWLTNIIVIPLATLILYSGFLFFIFSFQPVIAGFFGKAQVVFISGMNFSVEAIGEFPLSIIERINISAAESIVIYCIVIFACLFIIRKRGTFLLPVFGSVLLLLLINLYQLFGVLGERSAVLYNINGVTAINFINGRTSYMIYSSVEDNINNQLDYYTFNHVISSGINNSVKCSLASVPESRTEYLNNSLFLYKGFVSFYDKRFFIYSDSFQEASNVGNKVVVDYLIYSNHDGMNVTDLKNRIDFNELIISSMMTEWKARALKEECERNNISCHYVSDDGPRFF